MPFLPTASSGASWHDFVRQATVECAGVTVAHVGGDITLVLCPRTWSTACTHPIKQPDVGSSHEHRESYADHASVILTALPLLGARPVHDEAVGPVHADESHEHRTAHAHSGHPREQAHGEASWTEPLHDHAPYDHDCRDTRRTHFLR